MYELKHGDCFEKMKEIPDNSIDMVLTDPPYGILGKGLENICGYKGGKVKWDTTLPTAEMFEEIRRILRPNGRCVLFSQEPYTSELITHQIPEFPFLYRAVWIKNNPANILLVKKAMTSVIEDICIFSKKCPKYDYDNLHPLRDYFLEEKEKCKGANWREILGNSMAHHYFTSGIELYFPTIDNYKKLQQTGHFKRDWNELKKIHDEYQANNIKQRNEKYPAIFNLWQGGKHKRNTLIY